LNNDAADGPAGAGLCDDLNDCTQNNCAVGVCSNPNEASGVACAGNGIGDCTAADACDGFGVCLNNDAVDGPAGAGLCDDLNDCTQNNCSVGVCSNPNEASGVACAGNGIGDCTAADTCDGLGVCLNNDAADGPAGAGLCDDLNDCTQNNCAIGVCSNPNVADGTPCGDGIFCNGAESCLAGGCAVGPPVCTDVCETCDEAAGVCAWCIFDHNLNSVMDGFDFGFFSGCFGTCFAPGDTCLAANYDADPQGCVGGSDFGAFSGCFGLTCGQCVGCSGPLAAGGVAAATLSPMSNASVQLVAVKNPQRDDLSGLLPLSRQTAKYQEVFDVEVWASLASLDSSGFGSVYVDVSYDPSQLAVEDVIASESFKTFSRGFVDSSKGLIQALGGCAPLGYGGLGAGSTWARVATLRMRAIGQGLATVTAASSYGPYGVSVFGRFGDLPQEQITFGELRLSLRGQTLDRKRATRGRGLRGRSSK